jgi:hypothetical protein
MEAEDAALVHRGADRVDRGRGHGRQPLGDRPQRPGHVLRLDRAEPPDDRLRIGQGWTDETRVPQPGMNDRAVGHARSLENDYAETGQECDG